MHNNLLSGIGILIINKYSGRTWYGQKSKSEKFQKFCTLAKVNNESNKCHLQTARYLPVVSSLHYKILVQKIKWRAVSYQYYIDIIRIYCVHSDLCI